MCVCVCVYIYTHTRTYVHICIMSVCLYILTYTNTYIYTYKHTQTLKNYPKSSEIRDAHTCIDASSVVRKSWHEDARSCKNEWLDVQLFGLSTVQFAW